MTVSDGGPWTAAEGCLPEQADVFATADGGLWVARVDGARVSWAPLFEGAPGAL